jgi:hypothetical protein
LDNFLTLARCSAASRHLAPGEFSITQFHLQKLAEHAILVKTFDVEKSASTEAVEALIILAIWMPGVGMLPSEVQSPTMVTNGAVRMALVLEMDKASQRAVELRIKGRERGGLSTQDQELYEDWMYKARVVRSFSSTR